MARKKVSEYRAKTLLATAVGQSYDGIAVSGGGQVPTGKLAADRHYVVKVDQGIKGRFKKGLVSLDRTAEQVGADIKKFSQQGFTHTLVEEFRPHKPESEYYLALSRQRDGIEVLFSAEGGVDIEQHAEAVHRAWWSPDNVSEISKSIGISKTLLSGIVDAFERNYGAFLELNPLVVEGDTVHVLDAAMEVDDEASGLVVGAWTADDFRRYSTRERSAAELAIEELAAQSQASFSLEVLHPDGQIFVLLSGGGASVVVADEVSALGSGAALANYGEYSGNPSQEETYLYTKQVVALLLASKSKRKVLVIGGGVANFTDIRATFKGVIAALEEVKASLAQQHVKVFVRRGGPHEREGLATMRTFLEAAGLLGGVAGPEMKLSQLVADAVAATKGGK